MEARQVMTSPLLTISPGATVRQAIEMMLEKRISGLPVVDEIGQLVGMISEGDLLHRSELGTEKHRSKWLDFLLGPGPAAGQGGAGGGRGAGAARRGTGQRAG